MRQPKGLAQLTQPWRRYHRVEDVDIDQLKDLGVRLVLLDRDNTCVPRDRATAPESVTAWFDQAREAGLALCLVSNNFHGTHVARSAAELGVEKIDHAMKPAPFALWKACEEMGVPVEQAVLIGDQVFTDVIAGNLAGVRPILVDPQSTEDLWYTQIMRLYEDRAITDPAYWDEASQAHGSEA